MNTLKITNTLIEAGLERKPAEAIAQIVDDKNQELATKKDIKDLRWLIVAGFTIMGVGFGYVISILNTIIGKLG